MTLQRLVKLRGVALQQPPHLSKALALATTARLSSASKASNGSLSSPPHSSHIRYGSPSAFSSLALAEDANYDDDDSFRWDDEHTTPVTLPPPPSTAATSTAATPAEEENAAKHCSTCTCEGDVHSHDTHIYSHERLDHSHIHPLVPKTVLPPPLPPPKYSFRRRVMPEHLEPLNSAKGRKMLVDTLVQSTAASYISLTEHFTNQSEPAYCGVTTLQMALNALAVDPNVRWKGGWRYFGSEDVLLGHCCIEPERVRRIGITMEEFAQLATCQGLRVDMKKAGKQGCVEDFRRDVQTWLSQNDDSSVKELSGILITSFSRSALGQTGDGHFSPIAAYHKESDQVLVLDVARFKYQPYWVSIQDLYNAMLPPDAATNEPRGWYVLRPPAVSASYKGLRITSEELRPAQLVPAAGEKSLCPVNKIKVDFCKANHPR